MAAEALHDAWQKKKAGAEEAAKVYRMTKIMRPYFDILVTAGGPWA